MPTRKSPFADLPPITDFASCQRVRPLLLHRLGDLLEVWRGCANRTCRRAKSCKRSDLACLTAFMQALPEAQRRQLRHGIENRRAGLSCDEAIAQAQARSADEMTRLTE